MGKLENKVAIVTGAAGGQGAAHAKKFVEEGAKVVITDLQADKGEQLADELGESAIFVEHDVSKAEDWDKVVKATEDKFGNINILVNNAGLGTRKRIEDTSEKEFRQIIDINTVGTFLGMKAVLPSMKKADYASIINISSIEATQVSPDAPIAYVASKSAVMGMTKSAALDLAEYNIRVNSVHPGAIDTAMLDNADEEDFQALKASIPLGRTGKTEEVSNLIAFLASEESSFSTGSEFTADGGSTAQL